MKNPFFVYILTFAGVIIFYQVGWSDIYPAISGDTIAFFCLSFVLAAALAVAMSSDVDAIGIYQPMLPGFTIIIPLVCFVADIVYTGLRTADRNAFRQIIHIYPIRRRASLHVFAVTFGGAFATIRFADFLYEQGRWRRLRHLQRR